MLNTVEISQNSFDKNILFQGRNYLLYLLNINGQQVKIRKNTSIYIYIQKGSALVITESFSCDMKEGMYASLCSTGSIEIGINSNVMVIEIDCFEALNTIGGPIEKIGRLEYIDGCSDTLLLSPSRLGEPCLNLLHFPKNTNQSKHFHPSFRFGIVASGNGKCLVSNEEKILTTGDLFYIPENVEHKFDTQYSEMNVIAFHPDSDWGPTNQNHPMINKTHF